MHRVTKHTLFHYDEIGILKPEIVNENGYRYYSANQFLTFDIISVFKKAGTPLREIKEFIEHQDAGQFLDVLREKKKHLADEQIKIERMQRFLQKVIDITDHAIHTACENPRIEECEEEYLIAVKLSPRLSEKDRMRRISDLYIYCLDHCLIDALPTGIIISKDTLKKGLSEVFANADYFFCKIDYKHSSEWLYVKPRGKYAVIDHKGSYDSIPASYKKLKNYIATKHLDIIGNAYEFELLNYIADKNPEKYVIEIAIQVG